MFIIYSDDIGGGIYDLGDSEDGRSVTFADGCAWFKFDGETMSIPVDQIEEIFC